MQACLMLAMSNKENAEQGFAPGGNSAVFHCRRLA